MLKYIISFDEYWPFININEKEIKWYEEYIWLNDNINPLSWEYVREIVQELEEVISWIRNGTFFWYETMDLAVYKKWYNLWKDCKYPDNYNFPDGKVIITYNYNEDTLITDIKIEEILKMMTEWRDYINAWEKETGKIKH